MGWTLLKIKRVSLPYMMEYDLLFPKKLLKEAWAHLVSGASAHCSWSRSLHVQRCWNLIMTTIWTDRRLAYHNQSTCLDWTGTATHLLPCERMSRKPGARFSQTGHKAISYSHRPKQEEQVWQLCDPSICRAQDRPDWNILPMRFCIVRTHTSACNVLEKPMLLKNTVLNSK